jgi:hypothetical protein
LDVDTLAVLIEPDEEEVKVKYLVLLVVVSSVIVVPDMVITPVLLLYEPGPETLTDARDLALVKYKLVPSGTISVFKVP